MSKSGRHGSIRVAVRTVLGSSGVVASAAAFSQQIRPACRPQQEGALEEVIVTGFKEGLSLALDRKRAAVVRRGRCNRR